MKSFNYLIQCGMYPNVSLFMTCKDLCIVNRWIMYSEIGQPGLLGRRIGFSKRLTEKCGHVRNPLIHLMENILNRFKISFPFRKLHDFYLETKQFRVTDSRNCSKRDKRSYGKVTNNEAMLKILPFIQILILNNNTQNQQ